MPYWAEEGARPESPVDHFNVIKHVITICNLTCYISTQVVNNTSAHTTLYTAKRLLTREAAVFQAATDSTTLCQCWEYPCQNNTQRFVAVPTTVTAHMSTYTKCKQCVWECSNYTLWWVTLYIDKFLLFYIILQELPNDAHGTVPCHKWR